MSRSRRSSKPNTSKPNTSQLNSQYALLVSFVFAAVVGQSLNEYSNVLFNPDFSPSFLALIGLYLLLLFSWAGYHQSLTEYPYTSEKISVVRLGTDFLIVIVYAFLLQTIAEIESGEPVGDYILGFSLVFLTYLISGYLRRVEYNKDASKIAWHVFMFLVYFFLFLLYRGAIKLFGQLPNTIDTGIVILIVVLMLAWRYRRDIGGVIRSGQTRRTQ